MSQRRHDYLNSASQHLTPSQSSFPAGTAARTRTRAQRRGDRWRAVAVTGAVAASAVAGSVGTDTESAWYRRLAKPEWQPPARAFPVVWTTLYALIAVAGSRSINRAERAERGPLTRSLVANLALNTAWTWTFFRGQRPDLALGVIGALDLSTAGLVRRARRADRASGVLLLPYLAWLGVATALNVSIQGRNSGQGARPGRRGGVRRRR